MEAFRGLFVQFFFPQCPSRHSGGGIGRLAHTHKHLYTRAPIENRDGKGKEEEAGGCLSFFGGAAEDEGR